MLLCRSLSWMKSYKVGVPALVWKFPHAPTSHFWLHAAASQAAVLANLWVNIRVAGGGENNSTLIWPGDCVPPSMVMKDLSEHSLRAPPWWLISCAALELRSDTPDHQTPLSLTGTPPLIAHCFIIVSHSVLACRFLLPYLHVREFAIFRTTRFLHQGHVGHHSRFKLLTGEELMFFHWPALNVWLNYRKNMSSLSEWMDASWCIVNRMSAMSSGEEAV